MPGQRFEKTSVTGNLVLGAVLDAGSETAPFQLGPSADLFQGGNLSFPMQLECCTRA